MRSILQIISILLSLDAFSQAFYLGEDATFTTPGDSVFTWTGNAQFDGIFNNQGTFVSHGNVEFVENEFVGGLRFIGNEDQIVQGDTIRASKLIVDKSGTKLILQVDLFLVEGDAEIISGVVQSTDIENFIVDGNVSGGNDAGYIEGVSVQRSQGTSMNFPMGINGNYNGFIIEGVPEGQVAAVEISIPDPVSLIPDTTDILGIAEEVQWSLASENEIDVFVSIQFNGIELNTNSVINGQSINTNEFTPVIVKKSADDSLFRRVETEEITIPSGNGINNGELISTEEVRIGPDPTQFAIALVPVIGESVIYFPDAFSPFAVYEDNRIFKPFFGLIRGAEITNIRFTIFDEFNNTVYSFTDSNGNLENLGWDGNLPNGQMAEEGIYAYYLEVLIINGGTLNGQNTRKGTFLLINR